MSKKPTKEQLATFAGAISADVAAAKQADLFQTAVAAAHLASHADGKIDDAKKKAIVDALEILSKGVVIEWEVELLLEEAGKTDGGQEARAKAIGEKLKASGQAEAGLLVAAFVAQATDGIDQKEAKILRAIGKAAGIGDKRVKEILKNVGSEE